MGMAFEWRQASPWKEFVTLGVHPWEDGRLSYRWYWGGFYCYKNYEYQNLEELKRSYNSTFSVANRETEAQRGERDCLIGPEFRLDPRLPYLQAKVIIIFFPYTRVCKPVGQVLGLLLWAQRFVCPTSINTVPISRSSSISVNNMWYFFKCHINVQKIYTNNL